MTIDHPLDDLRCAAIQLRGLADQAETMLAIETAFRDLPDRYATFVRLTANLARVAASTLDEAIKLHLATSEALGHPQPKPRLRLNVIDGGAA